MLSDPYCIWCQSSLIWWQSTTSNVSTLETLQLQLICLNITRIPHLLWLCTFISVWHHRWEGIMWLDVVCAHAYLHIRSRGEYRCITYLATISFSPQIMHLYASLNHTPTYSLRSVWITNWVFFFKIPKSLLQALGYIIERKTQPLSAELVSCFRGLSASLSLTTLCHNICMFML